MGWIIEKWPNGFCDILQRTKDYILTYRRSDWLKIVGYSNYDFVECLDSKRSISGYIFTLTEGAISWKSVKLTLIASSTIEAEFIACFEASNDTIRQSNFIMRLHVVYGIERPLKVYCDNKVIVLYSHNNKSSLKSKLFLLLKKEFWVNYCQ